MRGRVILLLIVCALVVVGASIYIRVLTTEREMILEEAVYGQERFMHEEQAYNTFLSRMDEARRPQDWERLITDHLQTLSLEQQERFLPYLQGKLFEAWFAEAENLLYLTRQLYEQNENSPIAEEYMEQARKIYDEKLEEIVQGLTDIPDDSSENLRLHYLKALYFYRSLAFVGEGEDARVQDLITRAQREAIRALEFVPKDRDTQVFLEKIENSSDAAGQLASKEAGGPDPVLDFLPSREFSVEGRVEGRH